MYFVSLEYELRELRQGNKGSKEIFFQRRNVAQIKQFVLLNDLKWTALIVGKAYLGWCFNCWKF
jgi:hypothetical protein